MIHSHQPRIFGSQCIAIVSSKEDGTVKGGDPDLALVNRRRFLEKVGITMQQTTLVQVTYDTDDFTRYHTVNEHDKGRGMETLRWEVIADGLVTTRPGHALFLPIADCCGVILFDPIKKILMVSHVGRQSIEVEGAKRSVEYLMKNHAVNPAELLVWLSPAVGKTTYPLRNFEGRSLHEVITHQLQGVGVETENIEISSVDTAFDENYFSHSQYLADNEDVDGRFAVVAMMPEQMTV